MTMHVVFVLPRAYPYPGGYESSIFALARYLVSSGHRATIFTTIARDLEAFWLPDFKTYPEEQLVVDGVAIRRFPIDYDAVRRRLTRVLGLAPYWRWKAQYWRPSFRVPGLSQALQEIDADLIHIGPLPYNGVMYAGLHAGELRHIPVVATPCCHLGVPGTKDIEQHYLGPHQVEMLRRCQRVFCMTATELEHLTKLGIPADRLAVTPFGIDINAVVGGDPKFLQHRYGVDGPVVLHLGMKAFDKGSEMVVEAMKLIWARGSNAWLVMAGPSLSTFDSYIAEAGRNCPKLLNLPPFGDREKRDFLASAEVIVQPSRVESLGLVLIEGWANRKPVIAVDMKVSNELVQGSGGGVTVPFGNVDKLSVVIEHMLHDKDASERMGNSGYRKALEYSGDNCWQHTAAELQKTLLASRNVD